MAQVDRDLFCELYTDAETMRFIGPPMSHHEALASFRATMLARQETGAPWFFAIAEKLQRGVIGIGVIQAPQPRKRCVEVGAMLRAQARGKSFGTETFAALVSAAFEALPIDVVWVQYRAANTAIVRLVGGLGFELVSGGRGRGRDGRCVSLVHRSAWHNGTPSTQGKRHGEHHQVSGSGRPGCRIAAGGEVRPR
jgi:RimJ/RimL family protein N-acetyltransferase